jgi:hypothetical protein
MELSSSAFAEGEPIPARYTCDGDDVSPPLRIGGLPEGTQSLALVMDDPDAPGGTWDHWIAFDISPTTDIPEDVGLLGKAGRNSWGRTGYGGPCPPRGTHRYVFRVFALDRRVGLAEGVSKEALLDAVKGHTLDQAALTGLYQRRR